MNNGISISLLKHQSQAVTLPWSHPEISSIFMIAGYSAGKTFSLVAMVLIVSKRYAGHQLLCGIGAPTLQFFKKTALVDIERTLIESGVPYRWNGQSNELTIGTVKWVVIPLSQPKDIYGYNFSVFCGDELEELEISKGIEAYGAANERTRITLPDGRKPFTFWPTTSQGMRACYSITESLKEKKIPFAIIRASTRDNTNLSPEYYNRLAALYTETERLVYLEGMFLPLQSGRVYPEYDEGQHSIEDFAIQADDEIHIGCDLNIAACCATAIVKRKGVLHIVKEWQFKNFGRAAEVIRGDFPNHRIVLYPDATGKLIMSGYTASFEQVGIEVRMSNINPPILERVFLVNKGLALGLIKRFKSCRNLDLAWKTRIYADNGMPQKSSVHPSADDVCDGMEYGIFSIFANDSDFLHLYSLTRSYKTA